MSYEKTAIIKDLSVGSLNMLMPAPRQKHGLTVTSDFSLKYLLNLSICITIILLIQATNNFPLDVMKKCEFVILSASNFSPFWNGHYPA